LPWRSVAVDDGQPAQAPFMSRNTTPSLKPRNVMSPPSFSTAGRTRVSISSLMVATVSASLASKNSSPSAGAAPASARTSGAPDMKCSMMAPRIAGLSCCHSPLSLVTEMKSDPKNTPLTPPISNSRSASGDCAAAALSRMSRVPWDRTARPGRNLSAAGLGVGSVWMNMVGSLPRVQGPRKSCRYTQCNGSRGVKEVRGIGPVKWARRAPADSLRHRIQVFVAQVAGHDGDRDRKGAGGLDQARDQRAGALLAGAGGKNQRRDLLVLVDQLEHLVGLVAFADHPLGLGAGDAARARRVAVEHAVGLLVRLRAHDVGDAEPLLIAVMGLDHAQHDHGRADAQRAPAREIERAVAFRRVVDHNHELRRMAGFIAVPLGAHGLLRPVNHATASSSRTSPARKPLRRQRRTSPTISLTAFMVSAASTWARAAPSASTESI